MEDVEATNPVEGEVAPEAEVETEVVESNDDIELDDDGNPIEASEPEDEFEEVERNGKKLKVAKELAAELMMQADYTRKTQEVAEQRKALEAEREAVNHASEAEINARADVRAYEQQLQAYSRVDWAAWEAQDPFAAQTGWREYQQLERARDQAAHTFAQLRHERTAQQEAARQAAQQETAKRVQEAVAILSRDIPGYSPELGAKLRDFGVKSFGFTSEELDSFEDPRMVKVLHAAFEADKLKTQQRKVESHTKAQAVQPAAKVSAGAAPKGSGLDDRLSPEEWIRRRNEQVRKRA